MPIKWKTWKYRLRKAQTSNTEPRWNRKHEETDQSNETEIQNSHQTKVQDQMASQVMSIKHLVKS